MTDSLQASDTPTAQQGQRIFPVVFWGPDQSTEVRFQAALTLPPDESISACMVLAITEDGQTVVSKPNRGWGLPGGHREAGETAEECLRREAMEEAAVELGELELVGYWVTKKRFDSEHNRQYPSPAYQLLYTASVITVHDFQPALEVSERAFIGLHEMEHLHHDFTSFKDVFEHTLEVKGLRV